MTNLLKNAGLLLCLLLSGCSQLVTSNDELSEESGSLSESRSVVYAKPARINGPSDIQDFNRYYKPHSFNYDMFNANSKYSWHRFKQSEHFFVFWEQGFGQDPSSASVPEHMRVDVDDLLAKAEQFYDLNVNRLKMCTLGQGKSYLDYFKIQIYLVYQTEWLATGSGYDNVIGALWVNPSTCKPVGKTIAHEIGHTFQYQVYCDKLLSGQPNNSRTGWRYGFGPGTAGGNGFWEQSAQFQAYQLYPELAVQQNYRQFTLNAHRHFNNEMMRYQNFWFMYYFTNKHGIESFSRLWKESYAPEDPLEAYTRIISGNDWSKTWDDYYEYASHTLTCDFGEPGKYYNPWYASFGTTLYAKDGKFRPAYKNCPSTSGFNVIELKVPLKDTSVSADLSSLPVGSMLDSRDPGEAVNADGKAIAKTDRYNSNVYDNKKYDRSNFRFGFVGIKNGKPFYGKMASGASAKASMEVNQDFDRFYLVVLASPETYSHHYWNDTEADDIQWPYEVRFTNVAIPGNACDGDISFGVYCNASKNEYVLGKLDFDSIGMTKKLAHNFNLSEKEVRSLIIQPKFNNPVYPQEGKIVLALQETSGNINYAPTATSGFWCDRNGNANAWGANSVVFFEFEASSSTLTYGHLPNYTRTGDTFIVHPVFIYRKNGVDYKTAINFWYIYR